MSPILLVSIGHFMCLFGFGNVSPWGGEKRCGGGRVGEGVLIKVVFITKYLLHFSCLSSMFNVDHVDVESCVVSK